MTISEHATAEVRKQQEYEDYLSESKPVLELKGLTKAERIREVFEEALLLLEPIADELMKSLNSDEKFKLYGLYKHIRNGPCNDVAPSIWNVEKYFKHQAYNGNRDKRVEDAMTEYVQSLLSMTESRPSMKDFFLKCQAMVKQCDKDIATEPSDTFDDACRHAMSVNKPPPQSMLTATFASLSKGVSNTIINLTGVVPLIPRGQLDISYRDLLFGAVQCVRTDETHTRVYEQKIERQWIDATTRDARVVTGLAVRSLFDLYFRVQKYPPGSEIIMSPPINVPAMVHVMKHHHIKIVGVDIPGNAESKGQIVSVDVDAIEKAMTSKTVAIMVVHPFGIISASDDDMQRIRKIADSSNSKVHVIEDSSEAYSGLSTSYAYMGSPHADICFYSFGLIKAASALGGGIALIRNAATNDDSDSTIPRNMELFESMERFHTLHYQMQTNSEFIKKILKALFLRALADAPLLYGLLCACYGFMFGPDAFENLVTSLIRGYFNYKNTNKSKGKREEETGPDMLLIRKRPSPPLLALMNRRFAQRNVSSHIEKKVARCNKLTKAILNSTNTDLRIPVPSQNLNHYYWIYPILCTDRKATCKAILKAGFDATHGATQLCCIPGVDQSSYPNARAMMDQTVYLPIAGPLFPDELTDKITKATLHETEQKPKSKLSLQRPAFFAPAFVIAIVATLIGLSRTSFVGFLHMVAVAGGMSTIILIGWSWFCNNVFGPFYLNTSCVFAKRSKMLLRDWPSNCEERKKLTEKKLPIISSLEVLRICETLPSGRDRAVFLTGGTGYIGSKILHDLLLFREQIGFSVVIVLCREHRNVSARDRIFKILDEDMFSFLSADEKSQYVRVINGDVTVENAGINSTDLHVLCNKYIVSHVIHSAASVSFNQSFPDAAKSNITSTLSLQKLATKLNHGQKLGRTKFVHISTAFIHGRMTGTAEEPLDETLFDLGNFDAQEIYKSMVGTQYYASRAYNELGFPNTYTFSKCVCEHLIATYKDTMQTIIIRPSIVGPAIESPYEGWAGRSPSTVVAAAALQMSVPWNLWSCGPTNATVVPVDIVSRFVLAKAFCRPGDDDSAKSEESSDDDYDKLSKDSTYSDKDSLSSPEDQAFQDIRFYHATWNVHSPESSKFCYRDMAIAVFHVCMVLRTMSRLSIIICLYSAASVIPTLQLSQETFDNLHNITCMLPVAMVGRILSFLGIDAPMLKKCQNFINLPTLFYFFMTNDFYFKSSLTAPATFSGEDYMLSCVLAASKFVEQAKEKKKSIDPSQKPSNITRYQVAGPWANEDRSIFWALSQPRGSFIVRFAGWVLSKVFYSCCSEVTIDLLSFSQVAEVTKAKGGPRVILAPTHRSYFDFLLVSYVFFCVPEIQMEIPFIVAADDFEHLPFLGTMARLLRAIFVSRKKTNVDPKLKEKLNNIEKRANGSGFSVEVFIEGTRSRDRRFVKPKTGVLKCLQQNGGGSTVVPIAISYERLPEQSILCSEADGEVGKGMSVHGLMCWLCNVFTGRVNLGKVHIAACKPLDMNESVSSVNCLVDAIQIRQQQNIYVSNYHIESTARLLQIEASVVRTAFGLIGIPFWPCNKSCNEDIPDLPENESELVSVLLQASPFLAPFFFFSHPKWAKWLNRLTYRKNVSVKTDPSVTALIGRLAKLFDDADLCVDLCHSELVAHGFPNPSHSHLMGTVRKANKRIPLVLVSASISTRFPEIEAEKADNYTPVQIVRKTIVGDEALGFWGFHDSAFVVRADKHGKPYVSLEGARYGIEGKKITKLIPFIENVTELKMNLNREAFRNVSNRMCSDCKLSKEEIFLLKSLVTTVSISPDERLRHGTGHCQEDIFAIREGKAMRVPDAVVWPETEEEVESLVMAAKEHNWCLFPFGGGTNVSQATRCPSLKVEPRPILSVDMKKMDKVLFLDEENELAHIEAGITGRVLEEQLRKLGYTMGHEPDSIEFSTLGGWIATKASGMKRSKYGNIEDIVMSVRVASSRGVLQHGKRNGAWGREACGLDLRNLLIGSEGCLGIITSSVVRIQPLAASKSYDSVIFPDFDAGFKFMHGISRQKSKLPSCVRLLDNEHFRLGMAMKPDDASYLTTLKKSALGIYLKLTGREFDPYRLVCATISYEGTKEEVKEQIEFVKKLAAIHGGVRLGAEVGQAGYALTFMIAYLRDFAMTYNVLGESFETFVPWSNIKETIKKTKERILKEHAARYLPGKPFIGARITQLYHEGACLYFYFCMNIENVENASHAYSEIEHSARLEILANGGSVSHHHGIGKVRAHYLNQINSTPLLDTLKAVKEGIDPDNLFGARNGAFAEQ